MSALTFRNKTGDRVDMKSVSATTIKSRFAHALDQVVRGTPVVITKHDRNRAVLISIEDFEALTAERSSGLDALAAQFDGLLARMQTPAARKAMDTAFNASPKTLGRAAVKAARR